MAETQTLELDAGIEIEINYDIDDVANALVSKIQNAFERSIAHAMDGREVTIEATQNQGRKVVHISIFGGFPEIAKADDDGNVHWLAPYRSREMFERELRDYKNIELERKNRSTTVLFDW